MTDEKKTGSDVETGDGKGADTTTADTTKGSEGGTTR